jgi:hypothetical protein
LCVHADTQPAAALFVLRWAAEGLGLLGDVALGGLRSSLLPAPPSPASLASVLLFKRIQGASRVALATLLCAAARAWRGASAIAAAHARGQAREGRALLR